MVNSSSFYRTGVVLVSILGLFLSACGSTPAAAQGSSYSCVNTTPGANVYIDGILPQVKEIYSRYSSDTINARKNAFSLLVHQVERWSSGVDIPVGNGNIIRITLTYISPELVQIAILNHQMYRNILQENEFYQLLQSKMNEVASREELIFLMTITYSLYEAPTAPEVNRIQLNIPMNELSLVNSRNDHILALDVDPPLREDIHISRGPLSGYIAFPISTGTAENCLQVIDRQWNTIINVSVNKVTINGTDYSHSLYWSIKYHPLVNMDNGFISPTVQYDAPSNVPIDHSPPIPVIGVLSDQAQAVYWQEMAMHVWGYLTDP